jgi:hypothetical protein
MSSPIIDTFGFKPVIGAQSAVTNFGNVPNTVDHIPMQAVILTRKRRVAELKKVMSLLHMSRERIRRGWCQWHTAMSAHGNPVVPWSDYAVKWDTIGSLQATRMTSLVQKAAFHYLVEAWLETSEFLPHPGGKIDRWTIDNFMRWSDSKFTSLNQVLEVYTLAVCEVISEIKRIEDLYQ